MGVEDCLTVVFVIWFYRVLGWAFGKYIFMLFIRLLYEVVIIVFSFAG